MNTVDRIKMILKERNIPVSRLEKELGFGNGYLRGLKKGSIVDDRLEKIANYLGVSSQYLRTGSSMLASDIFRNQGKIKFNLPEIDPILSDEEIELLDSYNNAPTDIQEAVKRILAPYKQDTASSVG